MKSFFYKILILTVLIIGYSWSSDSNEDVAPVTEDPDPDTDPDTDPDPTG